MKFVFLLLFFGFVIFEQCICCSVSKLYECICMIIDYEQYVGKKFFIIVDRVEVIFIVLNFVIIFYFIDVKII